MNNALQVFDYKGSAVRTVEKDGEVWFVAKDVCDVLELKNHRDAISVLDEDERRVSEIPTPSNGGHSAVNLINEPGVYALVFRSNKPEAKNFSRWVRHDVLPEIRRTGSYNAGGMSKAEIELRYKELEDRRIELNLRGAQILQSMIDKQLFPVTPETRTVFAHEVFKLVTGHPYLAMLPECTEKWYTAGDIGSLLGISANKVRCIAKAHGIKAPEGEHNEFGRWIFSKSKYSSREVPSFIYSEAALDWFKLHLSEETA